MAYDRLTKRWTRNERLNRATSNEVLRRRMRAIGKKGRAWSNARRKLKLIFFSMGILSCEAALADCMGSDGLGFAHLHKRRNLDPADLGDPDKVAFLCNHCHWQYEKQGEAKMGPAIQAIIDDRPNRLARAA